MIMGACSEEENKEYFRQQEEKRNKESWDRHHQPGGSGHFEGPKGCILYLILGVLFTILLMV